MRRTIFICRNRSLIDFIGLLCYNVNVEYDCGRRDAIENDFNGYTGYSMYCAYSEYIVTIRQGRTFGCNFRRRAQLWSRQNRGFDALLSKVTKITAFIFIAIAVILIKIQ